MENPNGKGKPPPKSSKPEPMDIEDEGEEGEYKNDSNTNILSEEMMNISETFKHESSQINPKESEKKISKNLNQQQQNQNSVLNKSKTFRDNHDKNMDIKDYKPACSNYQNISSNYIENNNNKETRLNSEKINNSEKNSEQKTNQNNIKNNGHSKINSSENKLSIKKVKKIIKTKEKSGFSYMDGPPSNPKEFSNESDDQINQKEIQHSTNDAGDGTEEGSCEDTLKNE